MTKYLVKIISICAFIVLIPVIIAGVALSAVGSSMHKLNIYVAGADNNFASYVVSVAEKGKESNTKDREFSFQNNTEVVVTASAVGYDFLGWYKGDDKSYVNEEGPLTEEGKLDYSFTIKADTQLTAVFKSKEYTLKFTGKYDDDSELDLDKYQERVGVRYGEDIIANSSDEPVAKIEGNTFMGWRIQNSGAKATKVANFEESGTYVLEPVWSNKINVSYYLEGQEKPFYSLPFAKDSVDEFELLAQDDEKILNAIGDGYEFVGFENDGKGAITQSDDVITELNNNFDQYKTAGEFKIIVKRSAIQYTVNVTTEDGTGSATLTYDATKNGEFNLAALDQFERPYYTLKGIRVNDVDYIKDGNKLETENKDKNLANELIKDRETKSVDAVAIWECEYPTLKIKGYVSHRDENDEMGYVYYKNADGTKTLVGDHDDCIKMNLSINDATGRKLEELLYTILFGNELDGKTFVTELEDGSEQEVELAEVRICWVADTDRFTISKNDSAFNNLTLANAITQIKSQAELGNHEYNIAQDGINIDYVFKTKA